MLSEPERQELKALAGSDALRDDCRRLTAATTALPMDLDRLLNFLSAMSRLNPETSHPRQFLAYSRVRI